MAQRRMFSKKITETDLFLEMPLSSQALYFHLNMGADDEGFIDKAKTIQRTVGASDDDMKLLIAKGFLLPFDSGVVVIRHWRIHNYIQSDRFQATLHQTEKSQLDYDRSKTANLKSLDACIQNVYKVDTQVRLGKDRIDKVSLNTYTRVSKKNETKSPPYQQIIDYLNKTTGKNFRASSNSHKKLIKARWNEGYTLDDFKKVIDNMVANWSGTEFEQYLQPSTLFQESKFDKYLNWFPKVKMPAQTNVPEWSKQEVSTVKTEAGQAQLASLYAELEEMENGLS